MKTKTAIAIAMQQFLSHNSTSSFTESNFEILNKIEFELESFLVEELERELPSDILNGV